MVSKGKMKLFDWTYTAICMVRQPNDELADMNSLTASFSQIKAYQRGKQPPSLKLKFLNDFKTNKTCLIIPY